MTTTPVPSAFERRQRGVTLIEILVALAIFAVAAIIALTVYDFSRKSFKKGENLTEQQQAVRIAFDRLGADLRMTGFNYNPDGDRTRPDEQIEAAYDTAVVIRADFDAEDPTASQTPESTLPGTNFVTVSVGNDEIVAYVLAKPDGSSTGNLVFRADISNPRDGTLETVTIPNVAMVHDDPPYTLYRVTFNNDSSTHPGASFFTRTPLIDNVYSMSLRYIDGSGVQINNSFDLTSLTDDIGGLDVPVRRQARAEIRRFNVELVGVTPDPDLDWIDENDPYAATERHRKFTLTSDIQPRNIGMIGIQDINADITPPSKPATPSAVPGHCGGLLLSWTENPPEDLVAYYRVNVSTTAGGIGAVRNSNQSFYYYGGLNDATTYYVTIQAVDTSGNVSVPSNQISVTTSNVNTPAAPAGVAATTALDGVVNVTWDAVTENATAVPAQDPGKPRIRDLAGYRVYRSTGNSFAGASVIADESVLTVDPSPNFPDNAVVNCRDYNYWVTAVDLCGTESTESAMVTGNGTTTVAPSAPTAMQAFFAGSSDVKVQWEPVNTNEDGEGIYVDSYKVYRSSAVPVGYPPPLESDFAYIGDAPGATEYLDMGAVTDPLNFTVFYRTTATDDCVNESVLSEAVSPACAFSGDVLIESPRDGEAVAGVVPVRVSVANGSGTYAKALFVFRHKTTGAETVQEVSGAGPTWQYDWLANPPGPYEITATVFLDTGCGKSDRIGVSAGYGVGCCLSTANPDIRPTVLTCVGGGNQKCAEIRYDIINNNCLTAVEIEEIQVTWVDKTGNNPSLTGVLFDSSLIWNPSVPVPTPAFNAFSDPKPSIDVTRNSSFPVGVTYTFNDNMAERSGQDRFRNTLTTTFGFRLLDAAGNPTSITGTCGPNEGVFNDLIVENP